MTENDGRVQEILAPLIAKAETGEQWAVIAKLEADILALLQSNQICGACGQPWTGESCGQKDNGWPFPTCYLATRELRPNLTHQCAGTGWIWGYSGH